MSNNEIMSDEKKRQRILVTALELFYKHGYKRVNMIEIAESAGVSRPGLYLYFKTKEEVFSAAILQYGDDLIAEILRGLHDYKSVEDKIMFAFEIWSIRKFDQNLTSTEAKEISDSSYLFARESLMKSYLKLELLIAALLKAGVESKPESKQAVSFDRTAHLIVSAARGFKLVAQSGAELRQMIRDLVSLTLET